MPNISTGQHLGVIGGILARRAYDQQMSEDQLDYQMKSLAYQNAQQEMADKAAMAEEAKQILGKYSNGEQADIPDQLVNDSLAMVNLAFKHNRPEQAMEYMKQTDALLTSVNEQRIQTADLHIKKLGIFQSDLAMVQDQEDWHNLWTRYLMDNADAPPELHDMAMKQIQRPYDPKYVEFLRDSTMTQLQKAQRQQALANVQLAQARAATEEHRQKYLDSKAEAEVARKNNLEKFGGSSPTKIKPSDINAMVDVIASAYDIENPQDKGKIRTAAQEGETFARQLMVEDPNLTLIQARQRALGYLMTKNRLSGIPPLRGGLGSQSKPIVYERGAARIKGSWYTGAEGSAYAGQKFFYDGEKLIPESELSDAGIEMESSAIEEPQDDEDYYDGEEE